MNKFDYYIKHTLKIKNYVRYTDDFVIVSGNKNYLTELIPKIKDFLLTKLKLQLHPNKVFIKKYRQGIDFLGYIVFPKHQLVRTKTKRRIYSKLRKRVEEYKTGIITKDRLEQSLNSYLGVLSHANTYKLKQDLLNQYWFWLSE